MKKVVLSLLMAVFFVPKVAKSQILISILFGEQLNSGNMEFGLVAGMNLSTLPGLEAPEFKRSFGLGLFLDYKISETWILAVEANVKNALGASNLQLSDFPYAVYDTIITKSDKAYRNLNLINIPVLINYRLSNQFGAGVGVYASYIHGTRDYIHYTQKNWNSTFERSFTNQINRFDFGISGMLHYHFTGDPGIQIRGKINYGFAEIFKETSGLSSHNFWYTIAVAIPIVMKL